MCRISSLNEAKTVTMEIQINSTESEFELDDNGQKKKQKVRFHPILRWRVENFVTKQTYIRIQNHSQCLWD